MFRTLARLLIANLIAVSLVAFAPAALVQPAAATGGFRSTLGQEFWVNFDANFDTSGTPTIYLSGAQNANVTITWPDQTTQQATVVAGTVTTVSATTKIATANQFTRTSDGISQTAIKIVSDAAISVYVLNQRTASTDASQAYPTEYQGFEYRVLNSNLGEARFSVIANETGTTTVTVTPKATLGSRTGGVAYTQTLQQGDVYSLASTSNMRGTLITSDKKISVTSSNTCVNLGGGACDHITEYIPPVTTWGSKFIVPATTNTIQPDRLAIMASQDNTVISVNGTSTTLALAGDLYEQLIGAVGETTVVTADKPVLAMQFVRGGSYSNGTITRTGDPAMVVITPVVQYLNDVAITTPATGFDVNTASLVVPVADVGTITFNGTAIPSGSFGPTITIGSDNYKVAYVNLPLGAHRITSTNGFGVFVYGYNSADSYAYAAAAGMVDLVQFPGGVAQVGYVAANQIGTPQQNNPQQQAPAQVVAPPSPAIFFNRSIPVGTTGTIRLSGVNLTGLTSLKIGDKSVEIVSSGDGFAEIKLPELAAGVYNFSTTGTRTEGAWIGTQQLVLTVVAAAANPNPGGLKSATFTITNFVGGSAVLSSAMKARIAAEVAKHGGVKSSACVGTTSGPTILSVDASLAQRRAVAVCNYIATLTPQVITTTTGKNTLLPGGNARKVTVTLRF
jgi:hypothetical protein